MNIELIATLIAILVSVIWLNNQNKKYSTDSKQELKRDIDRVYVRMEKVETALKEDIREMAKNQVEIEKGLSALKAMVETYFRVRIDPHSPTPPDNPEQPRTGTDG